MEDMWTSETEQPQKSQLGEWKFDLGYWFLNNIQSFYFVKRANKHQATKEADIS